jgi:hypothetical protein
MFKTEVLRGPLYAGLLVIAGSALILARGPASEGQTAASEHPTFTKDVAPILQRSCQSCHQPGSIGPMSLLSYEEARPWAKSIKAKVVGGDMPPWYIDKRMGVRHFKNDVSLTATEIDTIAKWVDAGAPKGNPADMPPARTFESQTLWRIGTPDLVVEMPKAEVVKAEQPDAWLNISVDAGLGEDRYIKAIEIKPLTGFKVIHHAAASEVTTDGSGDALGQFLVEYAVGKNGDIFPEGSGRLLRAGSKIIFNLHLHARGENDTARVAIAFKLYPKGETPKYVLNTVHIGDQEDLDIPAGDANARADGYSILSKPSRLTSFQPHMHIRGKAMCMEAILPMTGYDNEGRNIIPINCVDKYHFGWHIVYLYADDDQPLLPAGTVLHVTGWHDNSPGNRNNPDPANWIGFGQRTVDDMSFAWVSYYELSQQEFDQQVAERKAKQANKTTDERQQQ